MPVKIARCLCESAYQDRKYGAQMRVYNQTGATGKASGWRCTVCAKMDGGAPAKVKGK